MENMQKDNTTDRDFLIFGVIIILISATVMFTIVKFKKDAEIAKAAIENGYEQIEGNWVKVVDKSKNSGKVEEEK